MATPMCVCTYLWYLQRYDRWLQRSHWRRARHILPRFLIELQLCQQGLLLLLDQMEPLLFLQLQLPLQLVLFLPVVVVEHLAAGSQIDVLFPQYVDEVHVLKGTGEGFLVVETVGSVGASGSIPAVKRGRRCTHRALSLPICCLITTLAQMSTGSSHMNNRCTSLFH